MTYLQLVNRVLRRLREDAVTDFTEEYTALVADFVADAHEYVRTAHDWSIFDQEVSVPLIASTRTYDLSADTGDGGNVYLGDPVVTTEATLRYLDNAPVASWFESHAATQGQPIRQISWSQYQTFYNVDTSQEGTQPMYFALRKTADGWEMAVWPTPSVSDGEVRMLWTIPEAPLDVDATDAVSVVVDLPYRPVFLRALYFALNERGEEIGEPGGKAETQADDALTTAKELDLLNNSRTNRYEFYRD